MSQRFSEQRVRFFHPESGWASEATPGATKRLTSSVQASRVVQNEVSVRNPRGGWDSLDDNQVRSLSPAEAGFWFVLRPRSGDDQAYCEVTCERFIDERMLSMLTGLDVRGIDLKPIESAAMITDRFCLPSVQADEFQNRVRSSGGKISSAHGDLHGAYSKLKRMQTIVTEMEQLCAQSRAVIEEIATENRQTNAEDITERAGTLKALKQQAVEFKRQIDDEALAAADHPEHVEHYAHAHAYSEYAQKLMSTIQTLYREHHSYLVQKALRMKEQISGSLPPTEFPATTRRKILIPLVEYYTEMGFDCHLTNEGMVIRAGESVVEFSDKLIVTSSGQQQAAEGMLGRQTAQRGALGERSL